MCTIIVSYYVYSAYKTPALIISRPLCTRTIALNLLSRTNLPGTLHPMSGSIRSPGWKQEQETTSLYKIILQGKIIQNIRLNGMSYILNASFVYRIKIKNILWSKFPIFFRDYVENQEVCRSYSSAAFVYKSRLTHRNR